MRFSILVVVDSHDSWPCMIDPEEREPETRSNKMRKSQGKKKIVVDTIGSRLKQALWRQGFNQEAGT